MNVLLSLFPPVQHKAAGVETRQSKIQLAAAALCSETIIVVITNNVIITNDTYRNVTALQGHFTKFGLHGCLLVGVYRIRQSMISVIVNAAIRPSVCRICHNAL